MEEFAKKPFTIRRYSSMGFDIFKKNPGLMIGFLLVGFIISMIISVIPFLGTIVYYLFGAALFGGMYVFSDKLQNDQHVEFSNGFDGFKKLGPFAISSLIYYAIYLAIVFIFAAQLFSFFFNLDNTNPDPEELLELFQSGAFGINIFIVLILFLILSIAFFYVSCNILFKNMNALDAIKSSFALAMKNPLKIFLFFIFWGFMHMLTILTLFIGLLVTVPTMMASMYVAWRDQSGYDDDSESQIIDNLV